MKKIYLISGAIVLLFIAWAIVSSLFDGERLPKVPQSQIPPPVIITLSSSNAPLRIFPGPANAAFVLPDGSLWWWGDLISKTQSRALVPQQVGTNYDWAQVMGVNNHCVGLRTNGTLCEWGWTQAGSRWSDKPMNLNSEKDWTSIAVGGLHAVALKDNGTLWAWGDNLSNQLGNGPGPSQTSLIQVGTNGGWKSVSCNFSSYTMALRDDGTLWTWGAIDSFFNGQTVASFPVPTKACNETNWVALEPGAWNGRARMRDGKLWITFKNIPNPEAPVDTVFQLIATNLPDKNFAFATTDKFKLFTIRPDGTLWEMPILLDSHGVTPTHKWRRFGKRSDWVSLWNANGTALGLTTDGTVWMWGQDVGQEPVPDVHSRIERLKGHILRWLGKPPMNTTTVSMCPFQDTPRPLLKMVYTNSGTALPFQTRP